MADRAKNDLEDASRPFVSVIVPHFDDLAGLDRCIADLERQSWPRHRFEIIVADNASPQGADQVAARIDGRAKLVVVAERGAGPARNGGVAAAAGSILAFTDSDCRPRPDWLEAGLAALARFDFVGGRVDVLVEDPDHMTAAEAFERVFAFRNRDYVARKGFTGAGNLFCPKALFEAVGGFRTGLSEDVEWSRRATAAGYVLGYSDEACVGHPARRTWSELKAKARKLDVEGFGLWRTRPAGRWLWFARSLLLPFSIFVHAFRVVTSPAIHGLRHRCAGLIMLARVRLWRFAHSVALPFSGAPR